jgi:hypothetical protein
VRRDRQTSEGDQQLGSPSSDWRWWFDRRCRRQAAAADRWCRGRGHSTPARTGAELVNVWHGKLHWDLGDVLRRLVGSGIARGAELVDGCPAAATGTLALVSRRLRQANKRARELLGVLVE